jgi:hypothetical protein
MADGPIPNFADEALPRDFFNYKRCTMGWALNVTTHRRLKRVVAYVPQCGAWLKAFIVPARKQPLDPVEAMLVTVYIRMPVPFAVAGDNDDWIAQGFFDEQRCSNVRL